jgi:hypothetical protein
VNYSLKKKITIAAVLAADASVVGEIHDGKHTKNYSRQKIKTRLFK